MFNLKKQTKSLYLSSIVGNLSLTGAWVAILAARGFSLVEIGFAETVFHAVSLIFEIPSGALADVFGRKKMLIVSCIMHMLGNLVMICSNNFLMVCLSIAFQALNYNFSSGSGDALAYDSMKSVGQESGFEKYESNQMMIYRICGGISTLCAGFALVVGHRIAYGADLIMLVAQLIILLSLREIRVKKDNCNEQNGENSSSGKKAVENPIKNTNEKNNWNATLMELVNCMKESLLFLKEARKAMLLMFSNSLVGAGDILLLFFLQARLPEAGIPQWGLGMALLFMEMGGVVGSWLIVRVKKVKYPTVFLVTFLFVLAGYFAEHSGLYLLMTFGGFLSALGDDALQVRSNAILQDMFPSEQRATLISVESFTFSVIMIVLSPLAGLFFTRW